MKLKLLRLYRRYRENLLYGIYLFVVTFLALQVARLLGTGWERRQLTESISDLTILADLDSGVIVLATFGLVGGLLFLMLADRKKRWQAIGLSIGFVIVISQLLAAEQLIPVDTATDDLAWALPGVLAGFVIGGGISLFRLQSVKPQEFRYAPKFLYLVVTLAVVIALAEIHIEYPQLMEVSETGVTPVGVEPEQISFVTTDLAVNAVVGLASIVTVRRVTRYDADEDFFVVGPPASGKTLLLIGAYLSVLNDGREQARRSESLNPSQELMELVENLDRDNSEWIVEATGRGELRDLRFKYVQGTFLPNNVTLSTLDYAGEHLSRLPDILTGEEDSASNELRRLADSIQEAETLIMLIDIERFVNNEGLGLAEYFQVLEAVDNPNVILVATKADIFADMFWEEHERPPHNNFDEFRGYVENRLTESEQFASLLRQTPTSEVHPVYYETEFNENGERIPYRDTDGHIVTVGYDELLEKLN